METENDRVLGRKTKQNNEKPRKEGETDTE